jgi:preprotein translocase subunit Sec63
MNPYEVLGVDKSATDKDIKRGMRMIPFMNLFYIKAITERAFND